MSSSYSREIGTFSALGSCFWMGNGYVYLSMVLVGPGPRPWPLQPRSMRPSVCMMTTSYFVCIGKSRRRRPVKQYNELLHLRQIECEDDGPIILHAGDFKPMCSDCHCGHLRWAEAGYTSWHRICDTCGSHWDLYPIQWGPARSRDPGKIIVRWVQGRGEIPLDLAEPLGECPGTWGDLFALVTPKMWACAEAERDRTLGMAVVPCA